MIWRSVCLCALAASPVAAQEATVQSEASVGSLSSGQEGGALQGQYVYELETSQRLKSIFDLERGLVAYTEWSPEVEIRYSDGPDFNSLVVSIAGYRYRGRLIDISGIPTPASGESFSIFPFSFGLETDQSFDNAALIAEVGYTPVSRKWGDSAFRLGFNPEITAFLQTGYKTGLSSESDQGAGADASAEETDSEVARIKLAANAGFEFLETSTGSDQYWLGLDLDLTGWYDLINDEVYHRAVVKLELRLAEDQTLDFVYENGAGAPNFNEGERFGTFLSVAF